MSGNITVVFDWKIYRSFDDSEGGNELYSAPELFSYHIDGFINDGFPYKTNLIKLRENTDKEYLYTATTSDGKTLFLKEKLMPNEYNIAIEFLLQISFSPCSLMLRNNSTR